MSNYELRQHQRKDKIKWIGTGIAFVLVFVFFIGLCMQLFGQGKVKPSEWFKKPDTEQIQPNEGNENKPDDGGMVIQPNEDDKDVVSKSIKLKTMVKAASADGVADGTAIGSFYLLEAITPYDGELIWDYAFDGDPVYWNTDNTGNVEDYLSVTDVSNSKKELDCLEAFGTRIKVTVTRPDTNESDYCICEYKGTVTHSQNFYIGKYLFDDTGLMKFRGIPSIEVSSSSQDIEYGTKLFTSISSYTIEPSNLNEDPEPLDTSDISFKFEVKDTWKQLFVSAYADNFTDYEVTTFSSSGGTIEHFFDCEWAKQVVNSESNPDVTKFLYGLYNTPANFDKVIEILPDFTGYGEQYADSIPSCTLTVNCGENTNTYDFYFDISALAEIQIEGGLSLNSNTIVFGEN